ncbi:hypothetical protein H5410_049560 [Solanum commersonii]|uniref:KOW domain-containing protein n=1 Tax=Solanum commersonii TaxID=4109 RepID=A0A9J5WUJ3_SOLCO|nr:hypothetical protein H5410_049560 [Solanum commersonii]
MVAMAALQSSFTSLSISSNSFLGQPFSPLPLCSPPKENDPNGIGSITKCNILHLSGLPPEMRKIAGRYLNRTGCVILIVGNKQHLLSPHAILRSFQVMLNLQVKSTQTPGSIVAKCKPNSLPVLHKMHVKLGDTVKVISGHDKGKVGEITEIIKHNSKVVIREINLKTKHVKSRSEDEPGQIVKIEAPIHSSNVMLYSKDQKVASRVGHKTLDNGKRVSVENWKKAVKEKEKATEAVVVAS